MVSNSAQLDHRTKQHTQFGVSESNGSRDGSRDMARTKSWRKKKKKEEKKNEREQTHIASPRGSLINGNELRRKHTNIAPKDYRNVTMGLKEYLDEKSPVEGSWKMFTQRTPTGKRSCLNSNGIQYLS